ncbi:unnamed protein product [Cylindrotheca closterium]|uniref:Uncharacterized protein n=1 Tax=Cylindrotheca closterium TaxID=2856 RepID=A0AAD2FTR3_9STRA|nr:unnamed protein product [Cylindrotheca closterium]
MFNFHKIATYYSTLVMTLIGGTFIRSPNLLLDAFAVLPRHQEQQTLALEGMDPVYQLAYKLAFASHLVVGVLGLYSILLHNHSILHRRMVLLSFGVHQAIFAWACRPTMPVKWQEVYLLPVYVNILLTVLLVLIMPESKQELPSLKRRRQKVKNKNT